LRRIILSLTLTKILPKAYTTDLRYAPFPHQSSETIQMRPIRQSLTVIGELNRSSAATKSDSRREALAGYDAIR
jgi:hypothetical protein